MDKSVIHCGPRCIQRRSERAEARTRLLLLVLTRNHRILDHSMPPLLQVRHKLLLPLPSAAGPWLGGGRAAVGHASKHSTPRYAFMLGDAPAARRNASAPVPALPTKLTDAHPTTPSHTEHRAGYRLILPRGRRGCGVEARVAVAAF